MTRIAYKRLVCHLERIHELASGEVKDLSRGFSGTRCLWRAVVSDADRASDYALAPFGALLLKILVRDPSLRFRKRNLVPDDKP